MSRAIADRYAAVAAKLGDAQGLPRDDAAQRLVDALWNTFGSDAHPAPSPRAWSWVGIYFGPGFGPSAGARAGRDTMVLGYRRNKPACSPIGMHGMCGRSLLAGASIIVDDVASLGGGYIACDPRDVSEVVVPLIGDDGAPWGVLDADSYARAAFNDDDARNIESLARQLGLIAPATPVLPVMRL